MVVGHIKNHSSTSIESVVVVCMQKTYHGTEYMPCHAHIDVGAGRQATRHIQNCFKDETLHILAPMP